MASSEVGAGAADRTRDAAIDAGRFSLRVPVPEDRFPSASLLAFAKPFWLMDIIRC